MKLIILKEKLNEGIKIVERISQKSLSLPILKNVLLRAEKNFLKLSTTNLESGISWRGLAKIEKEGQVCIPTNFLSSLITSLPNKPIEIELKDLTINLRCGNYNTKIKGLNPEDFPIIPHPKEEKVISVDSVVFCESINQIINIPSPSESRPEISGVFLSFQKDLIKIVATDSFRLAEKKIYSKTGLSKEYSLIVPHSAVKEIMGVFGEKKGDLQIYISPNQVLFEYITDGISQPQIQFTSRLIEGEYPAYEEIIPQKYKTKTQLNKREFLNQIKAASLFSGKINEIKVNINKKEGNIEVLSQNPDLGEYRSVLNGKIEGEDISISFNHRFLSSGVSEINEEDIVFNLTDKDGPAALKPLNKDDYLYIIMPIKPT